jgi:hypothetical protein
MASRGATSAARGRGEEPEKDRKLHSRSPQAKDRGSRARDVVVLTASMFGLD